MGMRDIWTMFCWDSNCKKITSVENDNISNSDSATKFTPFATVGFFSGILFCWLNPLMHLGKKKTIEEHDVPKLREVDRAGYCYSQFLGELSKRKKGGSLSKSSVLWTLVACHWRDSLISGFFALVKIVSLSAGPLLLNSLIKISEGKEAFKYERYLLAFSLFFSKILESLSQRQWYFQCTLIGLKVKSALMAAVYEKQLKSSCVEEDSL